MATTPTRVMPVFETLRTEILTGALLPGDAVNEVTIARRLGVSHTPVREALMELIGQGFIESGPNRRRHVAFYSPRRAVEIVQLQGLVYQYAWRRVATVATPADAVRLADRVATVAAILRSGDGSALGAANSALVDDICALSGDSAVACALPAANERAFALVLLPPEVVPMWHDWTRDMQEFAQRLRVGDVAGTADGYLTATFALAARIADRWPQPRHWPDEREVGETRGGAVATRIRHDLFAGRFDRDRSIGEVELARRYGVSTTPVREALRLLTSQGLIATGPNGRRRIVSSDEREIADMVGLLDHLLAWQHRAGLARMTRGEFDRLRQLIDELTAAGIAADGHEYPTRLLSIVEYTAMVAGNHEVWRRVRRLLSVLLSQRVARPWADHCELRGDLGRLRYEDRFVALPRLSAYLMAGLRDDVMPAGVPL